MTEKSNSDGIGERTGQSQTADSASPRTVETARPSDMAGGNAGRPSSTDQAGSKYAGEPGPAGVRGENHMDPVREQRDD